MLVSLKKIIVFLAAITSAWVAASGCPVVINPLNYGLLNARTGVERFNILMQCHQDAVANNYKVCYKGIESIEVEMPEAAESIPLPEFVDFAGVEITVSTKGKSKFLFSMTQPLKNVVITGHETDAGNYTNNTLLKNGEYLVVVTDKTPWVKQRRGYEYGATRKEVFHIKNGRSKERPVSSYQTNGSSPQGRCCSVNSHRKEIKNVKFIRANKSEGKVFCIKIENQYRVMLDGITIITPDDETKYGDAAIQLINCVDIHLKNIEIQGTYSQSGQYGYGVNIDNVNGLKVESMYARAKWGVFGTYNLKNVQLTNCDINRFDIHCYGKNVKAENCKFEGMYNQYSSVYGTIEYKNCEFINTVPVMIESSYNAFTPFDLVFKGCTFYLTTKKNYLVALNGVSNTSEEREELRRKCLPNITVKNCIVNIGDGIEDWYLINTGDVKYQNAFDYVSRYSIRNVKVIGNNVRFGTSTGDLKTTGAVKKVYDFK